MIEGIGAVVTEILPRCMDCVDCASTLNFGKETTRCGMKTSIVSPMRNFPIRSSIPEIIAFISKATER